MKCIDAKMKVLKEMKKKYKGEKSGDMHGDMKEAMKVSVIAKDKKGLKEGLSKAQQIMKGRMGEDMADGGVKKDQDYKDNTQGEKDFDDKSKESGMEDGVISRGFKARLKKDLKKKA